MRAARAHDRLTVKQSGDAPTAAQRSSPSRHGHGVTQLEVSRLVTRRDRDVTW
jgi:hypothetical protein